MKSGKTRSSKDRRAARGGRGARRRGAFVPGVGARASRPLPRRHRHRPRRHPQRRPRPGFPHRRARPFFRQRAAADRLRAARRDRSDRDRARPRRARRRLGTGHAVMAAFCRDCLPRHRRRRALPGLLLAAHPAPSRARHADHLPCRLRRLLRHHREARRPDARRQAADHRRRQARRGLDRLLHRPHLRRALGDADVRGEAGSARTPPSSAPNMEKYAAVSRQVRALMLDMTPQVEPISIDEAFMDLAGTARLHGMSAAKVLARFSARSKRRSASPSRSGSPPTSSWPRSPPTSTSRAASPCWARPRPPRSWPTSRCR